MRVLLGVGTIALALGIGIVPQVTDCQSQGKAIVLSNGSTIPMKCHWTAQAEIAVAAPLAAVGTMTVLSRRKESARYLAITAGVLGLVAIMIPTQLIGVCPSVSMLCHSVMEPSLIALGGLVIAASVGQIVISGRAWR